MIRFAHPELLSLLILLLPLAFIGGKEGSASSLKFPGVDMLKNLGVAKRTSLGQLKKALRFLSLIFLIIALARPQYVQGFTEIEASGVDVMLVLDVSGSMEALDFELDGKRSNRLDVVKSVTRDFIRARPNDRIGIVAFAARPYVASPLTLDHDWLLNRLDSLKVGSIEDGTAIGSALATASDRLQSQESKSKLVILLTDGMNNSGKVAPLTAAEAAKALGIKVYTVGAGTKGEVPIPTVDEFGRKRLMRANVDIDEVTLKQISEKTGGLFYRATDTKSLASIYQEINKLEKTTRKMKQFSSSKELFTVLSWLTLALLAAEQLLTHAWYRQVP
ncbi:MAG: VWA domain-containing protein [SAR324 cluster bacterium]|uniref:VWA domain-containing protein n=1 Tax=SAR324 cluster bacterium TaxID=2024889 RepID=A0A7X9IKB4_9DELT|nr:VWA domain-containing protein [SAR324 cluster bacterium]